jgi:hypothetical protein
MTIKEGEGGTFPQALNCGSKFREIGHSRKRLAHDDKHGECLYMLQSYNLGCRWYVLVVLNRDYEIDSGVDLLTMKPYSADDALANFRNPISLSAKSYSSPARFSFARSIPIPSWASRQARQKSAETAKLESVLTNEG